MVSVGWSIGAHQYSGLDPVWMESVVIVAVVVTGVEVVEVVEVVRVVVEENVDAVGWGFSGLQRYPHHQHPYHHFPEIVSGLLVTLEIYCECWVGHRGVEWGSDSFKSDYTITVMGGNLPLILVG
jgi:hypothetical protein